MNDENLQQRQYSVERCRRIVNKRRHRFYRSIKDVCQPELDLNRYADECLICGKPIDPPRKSYCSAECVKRNWYVRHRNLTVVASDPCVICGKSFTRHAAHPKAKTCGKGCLDTWSYQRSKPKIIAYQKIYTKNNPEKVRQYARNYYKNHSTTVCLKKRLRKVKISPQEWIDLCQRQSNRCAWCLKQFTPETLTIDHFHPISKGGGNELTNIQALCFPCNIKKGNRIYPRDEFLVPSNCPTGDEV